MYLTRRILTIVLSLFICCVVQAQQQDSVSITLVPPPAIDSVGPPPPRPGFVRRFFMKDYPNPRRAALFSAIIPGAGQVYNKRWWKLPIVYGALGTALYFEFDNINQYRKLRDNYRWQVDEDPNTNPFEEPYIYLDATTTKGYRDQWRKYVEFSSIVVGLAYLLQVTDAFVDAHLHSFDVSDDLSLRIQPKLETSSGLGATFGLGVSLQFGTSQSSKQHRLTLP